LGIYSRGEKRSIDIEAHDLQSDVARGEEVSILMSRYTYAVAKLYVEEKSRENSNFV
jgi:hypothetical protein